MQVFLCWSGAPSHSILHALHGVLGDVIQDLKPFRLSESIRKGSGGSRKSVSGWCKCEDGVS